MTTDGHLACDALNAPVVETKPRHPRVVPCPIDRSKLAQSIRGDGDLLDLTITRDGKGFHYVEDNMNRLAEATR